MVGGSFYLQGQKKKEKKIIATLNRSPDLGLSTKPHAGDCWKD